MEEEEEEERVSKGWRRWRRRRRESAKGGGGTQEFRVEVLFAGGFGFLRGFDCFLFLCDTSTSQSPAALVLLQSWTQWNLLGPGRTSVDPAEPSRFWQNLRRTSRTF